MNSVMKFKLTCYCCGSSDFVVKELPLVSVGNENYLMHEDVEKEKVVCNKCGLEDYVVNLVVSPYIEVKH